MPCKLLSEKPSVPYRALARQTAGYPKPTEACAVRCSVTCQTSVTSLRLLRIRTRLDVGIDLREIAQRVEPLVVALDRVGVQHHAGQLAKHAADDLVFGSRVAGNFDRPRSRAT